MKSSCSYAKHTKTDWKNITKSTNFGNTFRNTFKNTFRTIKSIPDQTDQIPNESTYFSGFSEFNKTTKTTKTINFNYFNTNTSISNNKLYSKEYGNLLGRNKSSDSILANNNYYKVLNRISQNRDVKTMLKHIVIYNKYF